jgi:filamentous hemagglutinin
VDWAIAGLASAVGNQQVGKNAAAAVVQASGAATAVDLFNRQLHPGDNKVAKILAEKSKGKFTEKEIQEALRYAGLKDGNGKVVVDEGTRETYLNLANIQSGVTLQDALKSDPGLPLVVGDQRTLLEQVPARPNNELIDYIVASTGGASSPYVLTRGVSCSDSTALPAALSGTTRGTVMVDGVAYHPLVAQCPAASCTNGDSIAYAIADTGTSTYSEAVARKAEKDINIATAVLGGGRGGATWSEHHDADREGFSGLNTGSGRRDKRWINGRF